MRNENDKNSPLVEEFEKDPNGFMANLARRNYPIMAGGFGPGLQLKSTPGGLGITEGGPPWLAIPYLPKSAPDNVKEFFQLPELKVGLLAHWLELIEPCKHNSLPNTKNIKDRKPRNTIFLIPATNEGGWLTIDHADWREKIRTLSESRRNSGFLDLKSPQGRAKVIIKRYDPDQLSASKLGEFINRLSDSDGQSPLQDKTFGDLLEVSSRLHPPSLEGFNKALCHSLEAATPQDGPLVPETIAAGLGPRFFAAEQHYARTNMSPTPKFKESIAKLCRELDTFLLPEEIEALWALEIGSR